MIWYLDLYFLVNLLMDLLILDLTKHCLSLSASSGRMLLGAFGGAFTACLAGISGGFSDGVRRIAFAAAGMILMSYTAFGWSSWKEQLCRMLTILCSGMLLAGGLEAAAFGSMGIPGILIGGTVGGMAVRGIWKILQKRRSTKERFFRVRLEYRGRALEICAIRDTGNLLYEPYHHEPVHVVTQDAIRPICRSVRQLIYIPYRSVGKKSGMMPGIRIDRMTIWQEGKEKREVIGPWLAISPEPLSEGHQYEMLLHADEY